MIAVPARWRRRKNRRPPSFKVLEWVDVAGRGTIAVVSPPDEGTCPDPQVLLGRLILLDGKEKLVTGVETRAVPRGRPYRGPFGLLVKDPAQ